MSETGEAPGGCETHAAGFTLIEMLVILAIVALISGILFPSVERALQRQDFAAAKLRVEGALRAARAAAIRGGDTVRFDATRDRRTLRYAGAVERLPDSAAITVSGEGIAFFPDGSTTGGEVVLANRSQTVRWAVRSATGAIERRQ
jgi:general secretion pathway protein H